jgi:hypothetical protein
LTVSRSHPIIDALWGRDNAATRCRVERFVGVDLVVERAGRIGHQDDLCRRLGLTALHSLEEQQQERLAGLA